MGYIMDNCPVCRKRNVSLYKYTVCNNCINKYGINNRDGKFVEYFYDMHFGFYGEIEGEFMTYDRECVVYDTPCFAIENTSKYDNTVFIVLRFKNPPPKNKIIENLKKMK